MSTNQNRLAGKVIIVTGAAQGIGRELALGLADAGADVVVSDIDSGHASVQQIEANGGRAIEARTDVADEHSVRALVERTTSHFGRLDGVINNAALFGKLQPKPLFDISVEEWDRVMAVNVRGPWLVAKAAIPAMATTGGGSIVNVASNRAFMGFPNMLHYDASKGAVVSITRSMAREVGTMGVRVNGIAPGLTMTENVLQKEGIQERAPGIAAARSLPRDQQPQDLVGAVVFLQSDDSAFMTGQTLVVDGGGFMH